MRVSSFSGLSHHIPLPSGRVQNLQNLQPKTAKQPTTKHTCLGRGCRGWADRPQFIHHTPARRGGGPRIRVPRPVRARRQNKCAKPAWPCDASFCASLRDPPGISGTPLLNREHVANCPSPNKAIMQYGTHPKMTSIPGLINRNQRRHVSPAHKRVKRQSPRLSQTGLPCVLHYSQHACLRS